jgi:hypothetical protein
VIYFQFYPKQKARYRKITCLDYEIKTKSNSN